MLTVGLERRDLNQRAATLQRVIAWMQARRTPCIVPPDDVAPPDAAARIIKHLALRGLVRRVATGWVPSLVLLQEPGVQQADVS